MLRTNFHLQVVQREQKKKQKQKAKGKKQKNMHAYVLKAMHMLLSFIILKIIDIVTREWATLI